MNNHQQIPTWLLLANTTNCVKPQPRLRFVRKMMGHLAQIFSDELYSSYQAKQSGLLQRIDPRTKVLVLLSTVLVINLSSSYLVYLFLITISYLYARLSNISPQLVFRRAWLVIPPLLLLSSIPAMCNIVVPGHSWLVLLQPSTKYNWLNHGLYLTDNGVGAVSRLVIRCGLSLSFTYLFVTTSCWSDFTLALQKLRIPGIVISILDMTYRYMFLLANIGLRQSEARYLRMVGRLSLQENRRYLGHSIALLFIKASCVAQDVYSAMHLRGYINQQVRLKELKLSMVDYLFIINSLLILVVIFVIGY